MLRCRVGLENVTKIMITLSKTTISLSYCWGLWLYIIYFIDFQIFSYFVKSLDKCLLREKALFFDNIFPSELPNYCILITG